MRSSGNKDRLNSKCHSMRMSDIKFSTKRITRGNMVLVGHPKLSPIDSVGQRKHETCPSANTPQDMRECVVTIHTSHCADQISSRSVL